MLTSNIDISDRLTNGQIGTVTHIIADNLRNVIKIYVKFDDSRAGEILKKKDNYASRQNCIPIEKVEVNIRIYQHSEFPVIKRTQFPLILSWACTIHKVQGLTLQKAVVSFDLVRQKSFNPGQIYVALSRVASLNGLYLTGEYKRTAIKADPKATDEYNLLREQYQMKSPDYHELQPDTLIITLLNTRSLLKHACDIATDSVLLQSDILCLTETQMNNSSDTTSVATHLKDFNEYYNHNEDRFCSLASPYRDSIQIIENLDISNFTVLKVVKTSLPTNPIKILLLYRKCSVKQNTFNETLKYLVDSQDVDIILGDFNINALAVDGDLAFLLEAYEMIVNDPTHISGSLLDHVYVKKTLSSDFYITCMVKNIYFSDHDAVRIVLEQLT